MKTPVVPSKMYSSWAQYTLQLDSEEERDALQAYLKDQGIPTMIYYPKPMHKQLAFEGVKEYVECPITEKLCKTVLSLPMHPYMKAQDFEEIVCAVQKFFESKRV